MQTTQRRALGLVFMALALAWTAQAAEEAQKTTPPADKNQMAPAAVPQSETPAPEAVAVKTEPADKKAEDEALVLSPFVVATDRDVGFVAASSLAGGRMATDLKDTPLAYSVLTKEFLETLNLTDTEKAMEWAVNTYISRDDGADRIYNYDGGSRTRSRGVIPKSLRNFFEMGRFSDTYNQDRIDYARGANALLIGNGGLGGAVVSLTKSAQFGKKFGVVTMNMDSHGAKRATLDLNQPLGDKVSIRGNFLWQDSETWRKRIFDRRKGLYLTMSYRPTAKTQFRVDYESYDQDELAALTHINDYVSGWDGVTVFNTPTASLADSNAKGVAVYGSTVNLLIPSNSFNTVMNWRNSWRSMGGAENSATPVNGVLSINPSTGAAGSYMIDIENEPVNRFTIATANSHFTVPGREDIVAPDTATFKQFLDNYSVFIDQQVGDDLFLQGSFNKSKGGRKTNLLTGRLGNMYIDLNKQLPNGQPNPHYLDAYTEANVRDDTGLGQDTIYEYRMAAAWIKDNTRFGSFRLNAIAGHTTRDTINRTYTLVMKRDADIRNRPFTDTFGYRYYYNDPVQDYVVPTSVNYIDPIAGTSATYDVQRVLDLNYTDANNNQAKRTFDYLQAAGFAKILKDRVTILAGVRRDHFQLANPRARNSPRTSYPADWDGGTYYTNPSAPDNYWSLTTTQRAAYNSPDLDQKVTTVTYGSVLHITKWMSGFYNYAQTYDTSRVLQDINYETVLPLESDGWDAGLRFTLMGGRINASYSRYQTTQNHAPIGGPGQLSAILESNKLGNLDLTDTGRNERGLAKLPAGWQDYRDNNIKGQEIEVTANLTKNWRLTYNLAFPKYYTSNAYNLTWAYLAANEATLKQIVLDAGATIDSANFATAGTVTTAQNPDINTAVSNWNSLQTWKATNDPALTVFSAEYKYTTNFYTDYRFSKGILKNLRVGAGARYRSRKQIGNRANDTIVNPANPLTAIDDPTVDGNTPVYMRAWYVVSATMSYDMKLRRGMSLSLNLNIENLLDEDMPIYIGASTRPNGGNVRDPSRKTGGGPLYYLDPRTVALTARLNF